MARQYRKGDRSTVPSNGAAGESQALRDRASGRYRKVGDPVSGEPAKREPGATLELLFRQDPDLKPGPFLAYVEQKFRLLGDIEVLREIRAYRAKHGL